jgi:hypothetical protein
MLWLIYIGPLERDRRVPAAGYQSLSLQNNIVFYAENDPFPPRLVMARCPRSVIHGLMFTIGRFAAMPAGIFKFDPERCSLAPNGQGIDY